MKLICLPLCITPLIIYSHLYENNVKQKLLLPVNPMAGKASIIIVSYIIITATQY